MNDHSGACLRSLNRQKTASCAMPAQLQPAWMLGFKGLRSLNSFYPPFFLNKKGKHKEKRKKKEKSSGCRNKLFILRKLRKTPQSLIPCGLQPNSFSQNACAVPAQAAQNPAPARRYTPPGATNDK
jgi:hypothetical protein